MNMRNPITRFGIAWCLPLACVVLGFGISGQSAFAQVGATRYSSDFPEPTALAADCSAGYTGACVDLGVDYQVGAPVGRNWDMALHLYNKACSNGDARGCDYRDSLQARMPYYVVRPVSHQAVRQTYRRTLSHVVPVKAVSPAKVVHDPVTTRVKNPVVQTGAKSAHKVTLVATAMTPQNSCNRGVVGPCGIKTPAVERRTQLVTDISRASTLYEQACNQNFSAACFALGVVYEANAKTPGNEAKAATYYTKSCQMDNAIACDTLRDMQQLRKQ